MEQRVMRISKMEEYFDVLTAALEEGGFAAEANKAQLDELIAYYEGGLWLSDYEADERGELPPDLKRGVLSQDGLYNLLSETEKMTG